MRVARSIFFQLYFFILTIIMGLGALPLRLLKRQDCALTYARLWSRLTLLGLSKICGIEIVIIGRENIPNTPCLIASQHQSFFDGFVWMNLVERPAYIIKKELTRIPLVGPMLILSGMIPVERSAGSKALRCLIRDTQDRFDDRRQVIIFPQGTRVKPGERVPLQPGIMALAKQANAPVVPVATNSGLFWPRKGWTKFPGTLKIVIGPALAMDSSRGNLIATIDASWQALEKSGGLYNHVDNSVDVTEENIVPAMPQGNKGAALDAPG
ncbi:1-acyl-sn-glycerol-3-phosphate acyltransferase [Candidatus Kirkpatrickella diaphorinae]|uniref:1-acyl-sn-glycerol-3-phosphate acyltransferase n=1 Tax=Candidatus Kirkpatrickella diaphorinae TaxID=2984322 RepID=A0ABY6GL71_9PROT|nr:lysophospholipid acyltransferase family protein [Candidatus Kirkpatrickella diaphorinae]UYH51565.1 1-acyl-sn-glycerol-3-phosphate acyltransferase [Candidatus Kirkpatrickella diaphorinae]